MYAVGGVEAPVYSSCEIKEGGSSIFLELASGGVELIQVMGWQFVFVLFLRPNYVSVTPCMGMCKRVHILFFCGRC